MPHSLVFNLTPHSFIPSQFLTGKHLHALFLTLVSSVDPVLGTQLHEQKTAKAFTISPLQVAQRDPSSSLQWEHRQGIPGHIPCWWRVSLLDDALFGQLTHLWLNLNPAKSWHLGPADLTITSILGTPQSTQPWANYTSYPDLYAHASEEERGIELIFFTPTTFRQGQFDSALPTPECVFKSLLQRWNHLSHIPFPDTVLQLIYPSFFDIRTQIIIDKQSKLIGCVGKVIYRILGEVDPTTIKQINTLANYALYAGVGRKTPMGMGIVRRK